MNQLRLRTLTSKNVAYSALSDDQNFDSKVIFHFAIS